jgi:hypothetical protein
MATALGGPVDDTSGRSRKWPYGVSRKWISAAGGNERTIAGKASARRCDMHDTDGRDGSHDFDFCIGRWRVRNERLVQRLQGCTEWETFEARCHARLLPGGLGNMDEFVTDHWPGFVGMTVRLYDRRARTWSLYWASVETGAFLPPVVGAFADGVGVFEGRDELNGRPIGVRFTWSEITQTSARWEQDFSPDEGRTWEKNWLMALTREEP